MTPWTILCDFDGTVSIRDATDVVLENCAAPAWRDVESDWVAGRIGSRDCMSQQVALIDASEGELFSVIDSVEIDPGFPNFVAGTEASGVELVIVSDGFDLVIRRILANHGLSHLQVIANELHRVGDRRWAMQSPNFDVNCRALSGTCKCAYANSRRTDPEVNVLLIGDGQSDVCVSSRADFVFAKSRLLQHCRASGIKHCAFNGFEHASALFADLVSDRLQSAPIIPTSTSQQRKTYA